MRLKTTKRWTEKRAERKVHTVLGRSEAHVCRCRRWVWRIGAAFLLNVVLITPFFAGMPLHAYWRSVGNMLLFLCLVLFIALVFMAGFTFVQWQTLRELRRVEWSYLRGTRRIDDGQG
jgi:hypothetical protein